MEQKTIDLFKVDYCVADGESLQITYSIHTTGKPSPKYVERLIGETRRKYDKKKQEGKIFNYTITVLI